MRQALDCPLRLIARHRGVEANARSIDQQDGNLASEDRLKRAEPAWVVNAEFV
jgi:hypothetical protein